MTSKQTLEANGLQEVVNAVQSLGLHFQSDFEYEEDFKKACYNSILKVEISKISKLIDIISKNDNHINDLLNMPIEDLDLSVRSFNCLKRAGKDTLRDLVIMKEKNFIKVRNLGLRSYEEVLQKIHSLGFEICPDDVDPRDWEKRFINKN